MGFIDDIKMAIDLAKTSFYAGQAARRKNEKKDTGAKGLDCGEAEATAKAKTSQTHNPPEEQTSMINSSVPANPEQLPPKLVGEPISADELMMQMESEIRGLM